MTDTDPREKATEFAERFQRLKAEVGQVVVGQQHLGGMQTAALETALPGLDQAHLADRRGRLQVA